MKFLAYVIIVGIFLLLIGLIDYARKIILLKIEEQKLKIEEQKLKIERERETRKHIEKLLEMGICQIHLEMIKNE